jgi:hypothetical protein
MRWVAQIFATRVFSNLRSACCGKNVIGEKCSSPRPVGGVGRLGVENVGCGCHPLRTVGRTLTEYAIQGII